MPSSIAGLIYISISSFDTLIFVGYVVDLRTWLVVVWSISTWIMNYWVQWDASP
ncbi:hypothetical protein Drorol1_Dr00024629, partial [Drosera rotundifolia]